MATDGDFNQAFASFARRENLPAALTSEEWSSVPSEIRERAFFMSRVTDAEILQRFRDGAEDILEQRKGQVTVEKEIHMWLQDRGYEPPPGKDGGLEDLSSLDRINVVLRTNVSMARGHASWARKQTAIRAMPCQRLLRISKREEPRDWDAIWSEAKAELDLIPGIHPTEKVALLNHPIWRKISRFDNPYPPFDFGSGMGVEGVSRSESKEMGFQLDPNNDPMQQPQYRSMNEALEVTPQVSDADIKKTLEDRLGRYAEYDGRKLIFTDPDGTKPYTADKLAEIWERPAPEGFDKLDQRDELEAWEDGFTPDIAERRITLRKLFGRIESAGDNPQELWRVIRLSARDAMAMIRGLSAKKITVPGDVAGWSWTDKLDTSLQFSGQWRMVMKLTGSSKAIDIRALRPGKPGFVIVGGTEFRVEDFRRDVTSKEITVMLKEVEDEP